MRVKLLRLAGVHIGKYCFIGHHVLFDDLYPENIYIGDGTTITTGTKILTHFYSPKIKGYEVGEVRIGKHCFIGLDVLIVKPVTIGDHVVVGGGGVITKDLPSHSICAGVPCKVIKLKEASP